MAVNNLYQPWRAILSMINQCLTGKTSGHDRPKYPVLQMLWGLITSTNVNYPELMWENLYKLFILFLLIRLIWAVPLRRAGKQGSPSPFHLAEENLRLGNLKFIPKGEEDEIFGMPIPNELISNNIRNAPYYTAYLEMVANHDRKIAAERGEKKKPATAKQPKPKPAKEKSSKPAPATKPKKLRKGKPSLQLIVEDEPTQPEPEPEPEHQDESVAEATRPLPIVEGKGKAIATDEQAAQSLLALPTPKRRSTTDQFIFHRRTPATEEASIGPSTQPHDDTSTNIVHESPSPVDAKTGADTDKTNSGEEKTAEIDEGHAGSDPGKTSESRPSPEQVFMDEDQARPDPGESRMALTGPDPEPTHDEFMANVYPNVQESLKFLADEHVILEDPLSSTGTLSSMKNLEDAYTIRDQFLNEKSTKDEPGKLNVEAEVVFIITVLIYHYSELAARVTSLEQKFSAFEKKSKSLDNTTQNLGYGVFTLELWDLPHKINQTVNEVVKEVVHLALQAPLRDRFREPPEADMKEILHKRMFESGTYKSLPEHVALYEVLEASIERAQRDEFFAEKDKSLKRRRDDQDPPPPLPDSDPSKKKRHASDASGSLQPPTPQSSAWKTSDTRGALSSSSKQHSGPSSEQQVKDVPMPDTTNLSESEDTDSDLLPKIKPRPEWLKPIPEEVRPKTPKPDWSVPPNHLPEPENN
ncbi:hypothetical protein Tco_0179476 [Tanacetum coccineum]